MQKYKYDRLYVSAYVRQHFEVSNRGLRAAVEHLRSIENRNKFTKIVVETSVQAGMFKLRAPAAISLEEILTLTPRKVWDRFDDEIDRQIKYFEGRSG